MPNAKPAHSGRQVRSSAKASRPARARAPALAIRATHLSMRSPRSPILSLGIITRNRADTLEKFLSNLSQEIVDGVEICVSDNASTDNTSEVVRRWMKRLPLRYQKNRRNIGAEQNVLSVFQMAQGEFVWPMGDDDLIEPGAIRLLAGYLKHHVQDDFGAVYLNAMSDTGRLASHFDFEGFRIFQISDLAPMKKMHNFSFISSVCLRRRTAQSIIRQGTRI